MKKFTIEIDEEAYFEILRIQLERKKRKEQRLTINQIATDVLNECLKNKKGE